MSSMAFGLQLFRESAFIEVNMESYVKPNLDKLYSHWMERGASFVRSFQEDLKWDSHLVIIPREVSDELLYEVAVYPPSKSGEQMFYAGLYRSLERAKQRADSIAAEGLETAWKYIRLIYNQDKYMELMYKSSKLRESLMDEK